MIYLDGQQDKYNMIFPMPMEEEGMFSKKSKTYSTSKKILTAFP